jgi:predicted MFS family arabinose efflux permease
VASPSPSPFPETPLQGAVPVAPVPSALAAASAPPEAASPAGAPGHPGPLVYLRLLRTPGALAFVVPGFVGRLPISMQGLGSVVLVERSYGQYALAGLVAATIALAQAVAGPALGRVIDRVGQARVLLPALVVHVLGLSGLLAAAAAGLPAWTLVATAFVGGGALPPVSACVRSRWTVLLARRGRSDDLQTAFAFEAVIDEVVFIVGPVLVVLLGVAAGPAVGLGLALVFVTVGTLGFVAARSTDPGPHVPEPTAGGRSAPASAIRAAGLRVLAVVFLCVGCLFGSVEVVMVAFADETDVPGATGLLLGCVAGGSLVAGLVYGARHFTWPVDRRFRVGLVALALGMLPLLAVPALGGGALLMAPAGLLAGLAIAPTVIGGYALVEQLVPARVLTEGFSWLTTALGVGVAVGSAAGGAAVDAGGSVLGFAVPVAGGTLAAVTAWGSARRLVRGPR